MKKILHLALLVLLTTPIFGQITVDPVNVDFIFNDADLTDDFLDLEKHFTVTNTTNQTISIRWIRDFPAECPDAWESLVCDNNQCYSAIVGSNIDPDGTGLNAPMILEAGESFDGFILHIKPKSTPGCCSPNLRFALASDPDNFIAQVDFNARINDENCLTSIDEVTKNALKVYPNPMMDAFKLDGNENNVVSQLVVYNIIGRPVRTFNAQLASEYDMSGLPSGIYLMSLLGNEGEILKTVRVSRQLP